MNIKLIVTDLDGTFLNSNHITIPQENIEAFKMAHQMGIKVAVASGRTKILTDYVVEQLPFLDYLITSNGACTYDLKTGKEISARLLSTEKSVEIFNILENYGLPYEIYFNGDCYMNSESYVMFNEERVAPHIFKLLKDFIKEVPSLTELIGNKGIEKLNILSLTNEQRAEIEENISSLGEIFLTSSFPKSAGQNGNLEMTDSSATKGVAVKNLADILGLSSEYVMCFGDGENDCAMLEFADYSFAMANGSDYAKSTAKFITGSNDEGGVAKAIQKYVV